MVQVSSTEQFQKLWSSMVNPTDVTLIFHSGGGSRESQATHITLDGSNKEPKEFLTTNPDGITPKGNDALYIGYLESKSFETLVLYVCHAGDPRVANNVAITFFNTQSVNTVQASPGYVNFNKPWFHFYGYGLPNVTSGFGLPVYAPKSSTKWIYLSR